MTRKKVSPLAWVPTAYFAMGLPFIMLNLVAPIMFNDFGISDAQVAFWTSLLILPWSLKPFWSPLLEMYRTKKFFVVTTQLLSGVLFGLAALTLHLPTFFAVTVAVFAVVAFSGATHDIAAEMGRVKRPGQSTFGFALETSARAEEYARHKLDAKNLDVVVLNSLRDPGAGFGTDTNKVTLIDRDAETAAVVLPLLSKEEVAAKIADRMAEKFNAIRTE